MIRSIRKYILALTALLICAGASAQNEANWKAMEKSVNFFIANDLGPQRLL